jgi:Flp pilus assembly protein TadG
MMLKRFWSSRGGNFAMMFGVAMIPMLLGAGVAVDYSRMLRAKGHLQAVADAAALSLAASRLDDQAELEKQAMAYVQGNFDDSILNTVNVDKVEHEGDGYEVALSGRIPTMFMSIATISTLDIATSALAVRGVTGSVEVALVLDNTWSMSAEDASGVKKIDALKSAAGSLVSTLHKDEDASVRIAVVPYADYVNVGVSHRYDGWVSVGADYSTTSEPAADCGIEQTREVRYCKVTPPKTTCTRTNDGVTETYTCYASCPESEIGTRTETYTPSCSTRTTNYQWFGCVGSRTTGDLRLSDDSPSVPYPGYLATWQQCLNPIVPLTASENPVQSAISGMIVNVGGYKPNTYIPAGLVWGLNVLSPTAPFTEAKAYDAGNKNPRKVIVLMTDGENTLRFRSSDGKHVGYNGNGSKRDKQAQQTLEDSLAICSNIKAQNIEIFSVAFAVDSAEAKTLLQDCATDAQHYFDANDAVALDSSFQQIADALTNVRLAR